MSTWGSSALHPASQPSWQDYLHQPTSPLQDALSKAKQRALLRYRRRQLLWTLLTLFTCLGLLFGTVYHGILVAQAGKELRAQQALLKSAQDEKARLLAEVARLEGPSHVTEKAQAHLEMVTSPRAYRASVPTVAPQEVPALPKGGLAAVPLSPPEKAPDGQVVWAQMAAWIQSWFQVSAVGAEKPH
ncbi:MAG: hypothetical protein QJR00_07355 [Bacillota bacterium]|nr:hypothetical protein [Bacillota bacterium]